MSEKFGKRQFGFILDPENGQEDYAYIADDYNGESHAGYIVVEMPWYSTENDWKYWIFNNEYRGSGMCGGATWSGFSKVLVDPKTIRPCTQINSIKMRLKEGFEVVITKMDDDCREEELAVIKSEDEIPYELWWVEKKDEREVIVKIENAISRVQNSTWSDVEDWSSDFYDVIEEALQLALDYVKEDGKYRKAIQRLGTFGGLFVEYSGDPRGPKGVPGTGTLEDWLLSMPVLTDVDGGKWRPVQEEALEELLKRYRALEGGKSEP